MKLVTFALIVTSAGLISCSPTQEAKEDSYKMPKGGMQSTVHDMRGSPAQPSEEDKKKQSDTYHMPKGGMQSSDHEMKRQINWSNGFMVGHVDVW